MKLTGDASGGGAPGVTKKHRVSKTLRLGFDDTPASPTHTAVDIGNVHRRRDDGGYGALHPPHSYQHSQEAALDPLIPQPTPRRSRNWNFWKYMIIAQGLAIIGLAIGLILVSLAHDDHADMPHIRSEVRTRKLLSSPEVAALPPAVTAYKFKLSGVFAQYPSEGGVVPGLGADDTKTARCCCTYMVTGKTHREVDVCAHDASTELEFYLKPEKTGDGSHLVVTGSKELIGAQCTLSWA